MYCGKCGKKLLVQLNDFVEIVAECFATTSNINVSSLKVTIKRIAIKNKSTVNITGRLICPSECQDFEIFLQCSNCGKYHPFKDMVRANDSIICQKCGDRYKLMDYPVTELKDINISSLPLSLPFSIG